MLTVKRGDIWFGDYRPPWLVSSNEKRYDLSLSGGSGIYPNLNATIHRNHTIEYWTKLC